MKSTIEINLPNAHPIHTLLVNYVVELLQYTSYEDIKKLGLTVEEIETIKQLHFHEMNELLICQDGLFNISVDLKKIKFALKHLKRRQARYKLLNDLIQYDISNYILTEELKYRQTTVDYYRELLNMTARRGKRASTLIPSPFLEEIVQLFEVNLHHMQSKAEYCFIQCLKETYEAFQDKYHIDGIFNAVKSLKFTDQQLKTESDL
jgi:hypothetical protein